MPVDPYLWKICAEDREALDVGLSLGRSADPELAQAGRELARLARRALRRRAREWRQLERRHVADLGYSDLGGEASEFNLEEVGRVVAPPRR